MVSAVFVSGSSETAGFIESAGADVEMTIVVAAVVTVSFFVAADAGVSGASGDTAFVVVDAEDVLTAVAAVVAAGEAVTGGAVVAAGAVTV